MKTLTIKEPWATLIIEGYKRYEFRSWKTNYRGKILIHAGMSLESDMLDRFKDYNLNCHLGEIIGEAELNDCILVDDEFNEELRRIDPIVYGKSNHIETYAWKLDNIKKYDKPLSASGSLGLWNYYTELEIMNLMDNIEYGWVDNKNKHHYNEALFDSYTLQSPKQVIKNKIGVCWDQVELERYYFKGHKIQTFFIVYDDNDKCPTHTFLVFKKENKYYWFEHSFEKFKGIHGYNSLRELLTDVRDKFIKVELNNNYISSNILLYEYKRPKYNISIQEFYNHCVSSKHIYF